ncbi:MAG: SDR family oxidoreductase [Candidatus Cloacimonetes bacterium]|nr:SDR family oxidoreductase [Candidatus Cloacimonadota bacterium]MCF7812969.1 SDR family oxidoreductase [Candidatus Cloacimonadota bacterium]MCF7867299.1 SDR family oxidoreductase [Candidatus Cloacimonadota bacterium]MCF7882743.1 SDR family oxidoreductase [Candidatus Cloacimonadota bacterium]
MVNISGKWALVTGSSRGIGMRVATALAENGCKVILHSRKLESTKPIMEKLQGKGFDVYALEAELSNIDEVEKLITEVKSITNDQLDILYNNAAIMTTYRNLYEPAFEEYQQSFLINSIVPAKLCDAFLPGMIFRNWGRIVNVTSGIKEEPQLMPYSCSKAALDRYVRDMVPTLKGTNVLMNLLDPDWLRTDLGGPHAPNHPDSVLPGALVPVLLEQKEGSGKLYKAQDYRSK